jgi:hypothetical protein
MPPFIVWPKEKNEYPNDYSERNSTPRRPELTVLNLVVNPLKTETISIKGVVAEPPKLYGPHAPVIVPKTSDGYACILDNLRRYVGCPHRTPIQLHLTTHTKINKGVTTTLQHLYKTLHQSAEE